MEKEIEDDSKSNIVKIQVSKCASDLQMYKTFVAKQTLIMQIYTHSNWFAVQETLFIIIINVENGFAASDFGGNYLFFLKMNELLYCIVLYWARKYFTVLLDVALHICRLQWLWRMMGRGE